MPSVRPDQKKAVSGSVFKRPLINSTSKSVWVKSIFEYRFEEIGNSIGGFFGSAISIGGLFGSAIFDGGLTGFIFLSIPAISPACSPISAALDE